jgi:hypothetical protein
MSFGPLSRPFQLFRANLSDQWLISIDLKGASLFYANLARTNLNGADLSHAHLYGANLTGADLSAAHLSSASLDSADLGGADLSNALLNGASLTGANLTGADLTGADLRGADLSFSKGLTQQQLGFVCGDEKTILPPGLKVPMLNCEMGSLVPRAVTPKLTATPTSILIKRLPAPVGLDPLLGTFLTYLPCYFSSQRGSFGSKTHSHLERDRPQDRRARCRRRRLPDSRRIWRAAMLRVDGADHAAAGCAGRMIFFCDVRPAPEIQPSLCSPATRSRRFARPLRPARAPCRPKPGQS